MSRETSFPAPELTEELEQEPAKNKKLGFALGGAAAVLLTAGGIYLGFEIREAKIEADNAAAEGLLQGYGFKEEGITLDVHGNTNRVTVGCENTQSDQEPLTFFFEAENNLLYVQIEPVTDAEGTVIVPADRDDYPLGSRQEVAQFINGFREEACVSASNNR